METTYGNQPHLENALNVFLNNEPSGPSTILWSDHQNGSSSLIAVTGIDDLLLHQCLANWLFSSHRSARDRRLFFGHNISSDLELPRYDLIIPATEWSLPDCQAAVLRQVMTWFKEQPVHTSVFCRLVPYDPDQPEASTLSRFTTRCA